MPQQVIEGFEGFTFGADPELFVMNPEGEFVCPEGLIPGTKDEPHKVDCGAVQVDGMAAEFNIDPVDNYDDWINNIKRVRSQLQDMLPNGHKLVCTPTAEFTKEQWDKAPEANKQLGCSPDFNAWSLDMNPTPEAKDLVRHAGGHIHFGWTDDANPSDQEYYKAVVQLARQLDWVAGLWSLQVDKDKQRRSSYGKAGSVRFKPYGMEYRSLSNFWLTSDDRILETWNRVQKSLQGMSTFYFPDQYSGYNKSIIKAINNSKLSNSLEENFYTPIYSLSF